MKKETPQEDPRIQMMRDIERKRQEKAEKKMSANLDIFMIITSVIYPIIGFAWCIVFLSKEDRERRTQGVWTLLAASIGSFIWHLVFKTYGSSILSLIFETYFM